MEGVVVCYWNDVPWRVMGSFAGSQTHQFVAVSASVKGGQLSYLSWLILMWRKHLFDDQAVGFDLGVYPEKATEVRHYTEPTGLTCTLAAGRRCSGIVWRRCTEVAPV